MQYWFGGQCFCLQKQQIKRFLDALIQHMLFYIIKMDHFWGWLTNTSAKTYALVQVETRCCRRRFPHSVPRAIRRFASLVGVTAPHSERCFPSRKWALGGGGVGRFTWGRATIEWRSCTTAERGLAHDSAWATALYIRSTHHNSEPPSTSTACYRHDHPLWKTGRLQSVKIFSNLN